MDEFWEIAFREKHLMWGEEPTPSAIETCAQFNGLGFRKVLIPGFGYGRNARPFLESGLVVTGIEISGTAIELAHQLLGNDINVIHGSVADMPFDVDVYDGVFCHALIHLLKSPDRKQFLSNCSAQLKPGGLMVFTSITKKASTYGVGVKLGKDLYRTKDGVDLFFFDEASIAEEFGPFGLVDSTLTRESSRGESATEFWKITCRRPDNK